VKPPVSEPLDTEHEAELRRSDGDDERSHVVPRKLDPDTVTAVPGEPDV
jgi:hypothetical protein